MYVRKLFFLIPLLSFFLCSGLWSPAPAAQGTVENESQGAASGEQTEVKSAESTSDLPPVAKITEKNFNFSPVVEGTSVNHDFIIKNEGKSTLNISKVKTGWGCTAVSFPRQIPSGAEGKIVIKVNTSGYGGRSLRKTIVVHTNDPRNRQIHLSISGSVEAIASINPSRVKLSGLAGVPINQTVTIIPQKKYPFKILEARAQHGVNIRYQLTESDNPEDTVYLLTVENLKKEKGNYHDRIELITDSPHTKKIVIYVYGSILDPVKKGTN